MCTPRRNLAHQCSMLTRRCTDRRNYLRPDAHINEVVRWEVAKAAKNAGFDVHGLMVMSNHNHIVGTDNTGDRSDFMRDFGAGVARSRNHHLGRRGRFWDNRQFNDTVLLDRDAIERKLLYTWLNPVRAGLVRRASDWPGAKILPRDWGKEQVVTLPNDGFYRQKKKDRTITFTAHPPPGYEHLSLKEVIAHFEGLLREAEDEIAEQFRQKRRKFRGVRWVMTRKPSSYPNTPSAMMTHSPRFATTNPELMAQAKAAYRAFRDEYDRARRRWVGGAKETVFPAGTIQLRRLAPIRCEHVCPDDVTVCRRAA